MIKDSLEMMGGILMVCLTLGGVLVIGYLVAWVITKNFEPDGIIVPREPERKREPVAVVTIPEARLAEMFEQVPGTPGWKATLAVLDQEVQEACEAALDERLTEAQLRWRLGGAAALLTLKRTYLDYEEEATKPPEKKP